MEINDQDMPNDIWRDKAGGFVVRSAHQLWGKHNEDIMAILFRLGFKNNFIKQNLFGWSIKKSTRRYDSWGIKDTADENEEKFTIPPGIVIPYIVEKKLLKVFIVEYDNTNILSFSLIPGSSSHPMTPGLFKEKRKTIITTNPLDGYLLCQEAEDLVNILVIDPLSINDPSIIKLFNDSQENLLLDYINREYLDIIKNFSIDFKSINLNGNFVSDLYLKKNLDIRAFVKGIL